MHRCLRRRNLRSAPSSGPDGVTFRAAHPATCVFGVAEVPGERHRRCRRPGQPARPVTCRARPDILPARRRLRPVALETSCMRTETGRDRKRDSARERFVTGRAVRLSRVTTVIKDCIKAAKRRESFHRRRRVADRADRIGIPLRELLRMTRRARDMSVHPRRSTVIGADMADETRKERVLDCAMPE